VSAPPALTLPVAVLVERRPGSTPWQAEVWRAAAVLDAAPPVPPGTLLRRDGELELSFLGEGEIALHRTDTPNYKENLETGAPRVWVLLRPRGEAEGGGVALQAVTADPGEAEVLAESQAAWLEALPMPAALAARLVAFVAEHHVERVFHKRKRDRQDSDSLGRRGRT
jgi:hypothetical protein